MNYPAFSRISKDVERRPCPRNTHTYTQFIFFQLSWASLATDILLWSSSHCLLPFSFFLWIQTGFETKAAFVPSRFVHVPTNLPAALSNFTLSWKKYNRYTARIAQKWSSTPFTRFQRCSLTETRRWKEISWRDRKLEKRFARPEIKMSHMRTSVLLSLEYEDQKLTWCSHCIVFFIMILKFNN